MLNPFPSLLLYSFFAPTLLRVAAALLFAWVAYIQWKRRGQIAQLRLPVVGGGEWVAWLAAVVGIIVAAALFFGYAVQWAAVVGAVMSLKSAVWQRRFPALYPISRMTSILLLVICLSLLLSGAGAMAFDLPL